MNEDGRAPPRWSSWAPSSGEPYLRAVAQASERPDVEGVYGAHEGSVPRPGELLAGKYRVERVLGVGGMGVVVAARHVHLDVPVALKFMTEQALTNHGLVSRFLREARATARLRGEHVVRVSDVGTLDSGAPYMVMEYLHGLDLAALLAKLGPPPVEQAVEYVIQACEGLSEAHQAGFVHRDVKPSNLFLIQRPNGTACIKVLDFGISKAVAMAGEIPLATSTRAIFGSPLYMAPEQMRAARDVDGRADVWSIGASLYELLTGFVPFAAQSLLDLAYRIANERPPPLRTSRSDIPMGLEAIVLRCLEKHRDRRFPDAQSLAAALAEFQPRRPDRSGRRSDDKTIVGSFDASIHDAASSDELETRIMLSTGDTAFPILPVPVVQVGRRVAGDGATQRSRGVDEHLETPAISPPSIAMDTAPIPTLSAGVGPSALNAAPVAQELPKAGSTLSWGRSQRLPRRGSRHFLYLVLILSAGGASSVLVFRSRSGERLPASVPPPSSSSTASAASATSSDPAGKLEKPSIEPPTIAFTDLSRAARPSIPSPSAAVMKPTAAKPRIIESSADAVRRTSSVEAVSVPAPLPHPTPEKIDPLAP